MSDQEHVVKCPICGRPFISVPDCVRQSNACPSCTREAEKNTGGKYQPGPIYR